MTVYFIEAGEGGPVKIGRTSGPVESRLSQLQCGSPVRLKVLATVDGQEKLEAFFHRSLKAHRLSGEWFRRSDVLDVIVAEAKAVAEIPNERLDDERLRAGLRLAFLMRREAT